MKTILIIDADLEARQQLHSELHAAGYAVLTADTAAEGLNIIAQGVDLAIVNVELPDQNGFVVSSKLKKQEQTAGLPIFITSSSETTTAFEQHIQLATHADGYFLKPLDTDSLLDELAGLLADIEALKKMSSEAMPQVPARSHDEDNDEVLNSIKLDNMDLFEDIDTNEISSVQLDLDGYEDVPASLSTETSKPAPHKKPLPTAKSSASFPPIPPPSKTASAGFGLPAVGKSSGALPKIPKANLPKTTAPLPQFSPPSRAENATQTAEIQKLNQQIESLVKDNENLQMRLKEAEAEIQNLLSQIEAFKAYDETRSEKLTELAHAMIAIATGE